jgi:uncharacterized protein (TIGR01777 family)
MKVVITGGTGFIGKALACELSGTGHQVVALSRNAEKGRRLLGDAAVVAQWDGKSATGWAEHADAAGAIMNLAGESISPGRWTRSKRARILQSRLDAGHAVVEAVAEAEQKPRVVIQSSGIGYYGSRSDEVDESSAAGSGFLPQVAREWEASTQKVKEMGVRQIVIRTGAVLGNNGGALPRLLTPFRLFVGGPLGSGKQYFPWIHLHDEVRAIRFLAESEELEGPFNLVAPESLTMRDFCAILGKVIKRPSWLRVPDFALKLAFGQMAEEVLLSGQRALPRRLMEAGYEFAYPGLEPALRDILS